MVLMSTAGVPASVQFSEFGSSLAINQALPSRSRQAGDNDPPDLMRWPIVAWLR